MRGTPTRKHSGGEAASFFPLDTTNKEDSIWAACVWSMMIG